MPVRRSAHDRSRGHPSALRVTVHLDDSKRGLVIGWQGSVVKRLQADTGARIATPKRGVEGPTIVTGPDALSVLHACSEVARLTASVSDCTCSVAGAAELRASLHPTGDESHALFVTAPDAPIPFSAYILPGAPRVGWPPSTDELQRRLDDVGFAAGSGEQLPCWALSRPDGVYVYGMGPGATVASALHARLAEEWSHAASASARPVGESSAGAAESASDGALTLEAGRALLAQPSPWRALHLRGEFARGGEHHGVVSAALRGKLGLGPVAKLWGDAVATVGEGEVYLVDGSLLRQLDELHRAEGFRRVEAAVEGIDERSPVPCVAYGPL